MQSVCSSLASMESEFVAHVWHMSDVAPIAVEYCPVTQFVHSASPVAILYLPAAHWLHVPPFDPDQPALHVQSWDNRLAIGEFEFNGQAMHVFDVAAIAVEY